MRFLAVRLAIVCCALLGAVPAAQTTTIVPLRFDEVVQRAGVVVEGTVVDVRVRPTGADLPQAPDAVAPASPIAPVGLGVEGGSTLFTEVTLRVDNRIGGHDAPEIRFTIAGGTADDATVTVFGMPSFHLGGRYILMLRPDYEHTNVPVVGVSQGFFEIVSDPGTGQDLVLNADGDIVVGIEGDRVALRRNPSLARTRGPQLGPAPVPDAASDVQSATSPEVERYWASTEAPMHPAAFLDAVRTMKEGSP